MKSTQIGIFLLFIVSFSSFAQTSSRVNAGLDIGTGYKDNAWAPTVLYHQELSLNHFPWFRIGWGVRATGYYAGRTDLAPKNSSMSGDSLKFGKITTNGISFLAGASVRVWKFDIGANTDLVGIAFGLKRRGLYTQSSGVSGEGAEFYNQYVPSTPTSLNVLPAILENNNGQSEVFARFWFTERIGLKVGYIFGQVKYVSSEKLDNGQNKFSATYGLPFASLSFPLYN